MYFYVDESGHTGPNLFDTTQPVLFYGVLSSKLDVDSVAERQLSLLRRRCGVKRLHAAELGNAGLSKIAGELIHIQRLCGLHFDLYKIVKPDHAIICFFDQVFDQGINPAITWTGYWSPMRFVFLLKLAHIFTEDLAKQAWQARLDVNDASAHATLVHVCQELQKRVWMLPDARSKQLIGDTLEWAKTYPEKIGYNVMSKKDRLQVMPNIIGFQSVMHGIALRIKMSGRQAKKITVDQQAQFNVAQRTLASFYAETRDLPWESGPGLPKMDLRHIPDIPLTFKSSQSSAGLELVDIHLWLFKRHMEGKAIPHECEPLLNAVFRGGRTDELSLDALGRRWEKWFAELPEPSPEQIKKARELMEFEEARRQKAVSEMKSPKQ